VPSHRPPGPFGRQVSIGDLCDGWDSQRDGTGQGHRR
jgi:hypothetical protein